MFFWGGRDGSVTEGLGRLRLFFLVATIVDSVDVEVEEDLYRGMLRFLVEKMTFALDGSFSVGLVVISNCGA